MAGEAAGQRADQREVLLDQELACASIAAQVIRGKKVPVAA